MTDRPATVNQRLPLILWLAVLWAKLVYVGVALGLDHVGYRPPIAADRSLEAILALVFAGLTLAATHATRLLAARVLRPIESLDEAQVSARIVRAVLLRCVLFETPAVLGLTYFLLTGRLIAAFVFVGYSLALDVFSPPTRARLRAWARRVHPDTSLFADTP
jgi:hypothetical protein